jgi:hypothetical protein
MRATSAGERRRRFDTSNCCAARNSSVSGPTRYGRLVRRRARRRCGPPPVPSARALLAWALVHMNWGDIGLRAGRPRGRTIALDAGLGREFEKPQ